MRHPVYEVRGAIERIDDPDDVVAGTRVDTFLADDRVRVGDDF